MITEKPKKVQFPPLAPSKAKQRAMFAGSVSSAKARNKPVSLAPINLPKKRGETR
jgi:hypothetical protein